MNYRISWDDIWATLNDIESNNGIKEMVLPSTWHCGHYLLLFVLCLGLGVALVNLVTGPTQSTQNTERA